MPHPAVVSGYEELLEVAEAILFSVPLPVGVLDKYKIIQAEVKGRIRDSVSRDREPTVSFISSDPEKLLLLDKLAASKRKNAALQEQAKVLEMQVSQLTTKISALHTHHKAALVEVQEQTRHACAESHARHMAELEARSKLDAGLAKQVCEDQLHAERVFHTAVDEKIHSLTAMFPEAFPAHPPEPLPNEISTAMRAGEARNENHPNSATRLQLNAFFEHTRRALNTARHTNSELRSSERELSIIKFNLQQHEEYKYAAEKALNTIDRSAGTLAYELDRARKERDAILEKVTHRTTVSVDDASAHPSNSSAPTSPNTSANRTLSPSSAARPSLRSQPSVERLQESEEEQEQDEKQVEHQTALDQTLAEASEQQRIDQQRSPRSPNRK